MPDIPIPALADRKILITGGSGGVGRAVAERMAASGARLLLTAIDAFYSRATPRMCIRPWAGRASTSECRMR